MATVALHHPEPLFDALKLSLQALETGVPLETMVRFTTASGLEMKDLYGIVIPARTLKHRRARNESLSLDESDKFARLVRIYDQAIKVFSEPERARRWLEKPKHRFNERSPLEMLRTEFGARLVEEMLGQIEHGMFA